MPVTAPITLHVQSALSAGTPGAGGKAVLQLQGPKHAEKLTACSDAELAAQLSALLDMIADQPALPLLSGGGMAGQGASLSGMAMVPRDDPAYPQALLAYLALKGYTARIIDTNSSRKM